MYGIQPFDIVVIVLAIGMTIRGGLSGMVSQIFSILSIVLSWMIASRYSGHIEALLPQNDDWGKPVAILITFVVANIGLRVISMFVQRAISLVKLRELDRQLGALLGLMKGMVLVMVITFFAVTLTEKSREAVAASQSGKYLVALIMSISVILPNDQEHAPVKEQLAKFKDMADEAKIETVSLSDEVTSLKKKLMDSMIDPDAALQTVEPGIENIISYTSIGTASTNTTSAGIVPTSIAPTSTPPMNVISDSALSNSSLGSIFGNFLNEHPLSQAIPGIGVTLGVPTSTPPAQRQEPIPPFVAIPPPVINQIPTNYENQGRIITGSIMSQPTFAPQSVAPMLPGQ